MKRIIEINGRKYKRIDELKININKLKPFINKHNIDVLKYDTGRDGGGPFLAVKTEKGNRIEINDRDIDLYVKSGASGLRHADAWGGFGGYDKRDMDAAFKSLAKADKLSK
mgnify:CR=1 FL=1